MKAIASACLYTSILLATAAAAPGGSSSYSLKIHSDNPRLGGSTLVVKDESAADTVPNPLGTFSSGEPRYPYTFTVTTVSESDKLYEFNSIAGRKHAMLNGDSRALQLFDSPYYPGSDKNPPRTKFLINNEGNNMYVVAANEFRGGDGDFMGPGSWRACSGGTIDYQLYWFDGLSNLTEIVQGCESVKLSLELYESSTTPTTTDGKWITGVPAPTSTPCPTTTSTATDGKWITGVPAPTSSPLPTTTSSQITIRIANDQTGANAAATVPADGVARNIPDLFRGTAIESKDGIIGTSAQLVKFTDKTKCSLRNLNTPDWIIELDGRAKNFADLDGDSSKATPTWISGFTFQCSQA